MLLLFDERSMTPPALEEKLTLAARLRELAMAAGVAETASHYDPVLPNLSWPDVYYRNHHGHSSRPPAGRRRPVRGTGPYHGGTVRPARGRRQLHPLELETACLGLLAGAGLDIALLDVFQPGLLTQVHLLQQLQRDR